MYDMVYCVFPNANFAGNFAIPTHTVVVSGFFFDRHSRGLHPRYRHKAFARQYMLKNRCSIYHNIRCPHPLRASEGTSDGKPIKQTTNHPKTRQKRA